MRIVEERWERDERGKQRLFGAGEHLWLVYRFIARDTMGRKWMLRVPMSPEVRIHPLQAIRKEAMQEFLRGARAESPLAAALEAGEVGAE